MNEAAQDWLDQAESMEQAPDLPHEDQELEFVGLLEKDGAAWTKQTPKGTRVAFKFRNPATGAEGLEGVTLTAKNIFNMSMINKGLGLTGNDMRTALEAENMPRPKETPDAPVSMSAVYKLASLWAGKKGWAAVKPDGQYTRIEWLKEEPAHKRVYANAANGASADNPF